MKYLSPSRQHIQLIALFLIYVFFATIFGLAYKYAMNPDAVSHLRLAGYIAEGHFQRSISSAASPLITWLVSFFIFFGFDGLSAARVAIALCGFGQVLCIWKISSRFDLSPDLRFIASLIGALLTAFWTIQFISSDVLFSALTLFYLYLATDPDMLTRKRITFYCGITGGFAYLAHHYGFPFFLAHFPAILFLNGYFHRNKKGFPLKKVLISWGIGTAGFLIITSIWITAVSVKYDNFTISNKGPMAHAAVGPKGQGHPFFAGGLYKPRDAYAIHVFEDPSEVNFKTWSPFDSKDFFMFQLKLIKNNFNYILDHFVNKSPFFTKAFVIGILALMPIAFLLKPLTSEKKYLYWWVVISFCIYSSGFLLIVARSPRRFYALMIVFVFLSFHFLGELKTFFRDIMSGRSQKILTVYLLIIALLAFTLKPGKEFIKSFKTVITVDQANPYEEIAEQVNTIEFSGPYAIIRSAQKPHTDYYIAYFIKKQLLGRPLSEDVEGILKELWAAGAKSLVVFDNPEIVEKLQRDKGYIHTGALVLKNNKKYLNPINTRIDQITGWDKEVNVFKIAQKSKL